MVATPFVHDAGWLISTLLIWLVPSAVTAIVCAWANPSIVKADTFPVPVVAMDMAPSMVSFVVAVVVVSRMFTPTDVMMPACACRVRECVYVRAWCVYIYIYICVCVC